MKLRAQILVLISVLLFPAISVRAEYVLPYPSFMPGHKLYRVSKLLDAVKKYWYWGNLAKVKYHLSLSDKYLVEAKTLFEYKQYLLATDALARSNFHFDQLPKYLAQAKNEGKDIRSLTSLVTEAAVVHQAMFEQLKPTLPEVFRWTPERNAPTELAIGDLLREAGDLRQTIVVEIRSLSQ